MLKVKKIKVIVFKVILSRLLCCLLNLIYYLYKFLIFCKSFKNYILSLNFLENYVKYIFILIRAHIFLWQLQIYYLKYLKICKLTLKNFNVYGIIDAQLELFKIKLLENLTLFQVLQLTTVKIYSKIKKK